MLIFFSGGALVADRRALVAGVAARRPDAGILRHVAGFILGRPPIGLGRLIVAVQGNVVAFGGLDAEAAHDGHTNRPAAVHTAPM